MESENDQDDHTYVYFADEDKDLPSAYDEYNDVSEETDVSLDNGDDDNVVITQNIEALPEDQQMDSPNIADQEITEIHMVETQGAPPEHHITDSTILTIETDDELQIEPLPPSTQDLTTELIEERHTEDINDQSQNTDEMTTKDPGVPDYRSNRRYGLRSNPKPTQRPGFIYEQGYQALQAHVPDGEMVVPVDTFR